MLFQLSIRRFVLIFISSFSLYGVDISNAKAGSYSPDRGSAHAACITKAATYIAHGYTTPVCGGPQGLYVCPGDATYLMRCERFIPCVENAAGGRACGLAEDPHYYPSPSKAKAEKNQGVPSCAEQCFGDPVNAGTGGEDRDPCRVHWGGCLSASDEVDV